MGPPKSLPSSGVTWPSNKLRGTVTLCGFPDPMLSRPGSLPTGQGWSYELKWGGFRALVSTEDELRVRS